MTGLERKSDIVNMAAYAPLFVNTHDRAWNPDMIVFDNHRQAWTPFTCIISLDSPCKRQGTGHRHEKLGCSPCVPSTQWLTTFASR